MVLTRHSRQVDRTSSTRHKVCSKSERRILEFLIIHYHVLLPTNLEVTSTKIIAATAHVVVVAVLVAVLVCLLLFVVLMIVYGIR